MGKLFHDIQPTLLQLIVLRVASIHLKDKSSVPLAHVQGPPQYQAFMRRNNGSGTLEDSTICHVLYPAVDSFLPGLGYNFDLCRNVDAVNMKALLSTLKTALESYLGTNICFATLILDDPKSYQANVVQEALKTLGLRQVFPTIRAAGSVVRAQMLSAFPELYDEFWVVLVVDYNSHWFNVGLRTIDEIGIISPIDSTVTSPIIGEVDQLNALEDTLRTLFANLLEDDVVLPLQIHHIVVYGNTAKDDVLNLLKSLLGADLVHDAYIANAVFDGVANVAKSVHVLMDTVDFEMHVQSAFGCQWRSKLYNEDHTEL
jgi:hypothetical protein